MDSDYLGEARGKPVIQLKRESSPHPQAQAAVPQDQQSLQPTPPVHNDVHLDWLPIKRLGEPAGDILAAFELVPDEHPTRRAKFRAPRGGSGKKEFFQIPPTLAPAMKQHTIEVQYYKTLASYLGIQNCSYHLGQDFSLYACHKSCQESYCCECPSTSPMSVPIVQWLHHLRHKLASWAVCTDIKCLQL